MRDTYLIVGVFLLWGRSEDMSDQKKCNHEYRTLADSINTIEYRADGIIINYRVEGMVLFHCTKCLDIQKKVII